MKVVHVPTVNDGLSDFDWLFQTAQELDADDSELTFDFSRCWFLRQNAVAFLGGLARLIQRRGGTAGFAWDTLKEDVRRNLERNDFTAVFGHSWVPWTGNTIPYREDSWLDKNGIMGYLKSYWLGRGWVQVSPLLRDAIVGNVWEIYSNAFEHSDSPIGVFSCGQHYPHIGELKLSVVDFGVGIPGNVRGFLMRRGFPEDRILGVTAAKALEWAFRRGTTTKVGGPGRGNGLDLLKNFVQVNHGRLEIFSHEGYTLIDKSQEAHVNRATFFQGTMVNITFQCDERYYQLASELPRRPLF